MVELATLQAVSYIMGSLGVFVAAVYYVLNLRAAERNKKIQLSMSITEKLGSKEFLRDFVTLMYLEWRDLGDFLRKYDSSVNSEESINNFAQRWSLWAAYENLGYLLRNGFVDDEIIYSSQGVHPMIIWARYFPVIDHFRKKELGPRYFENFEYLAKRMWSMGKTRGLTSNDYKGGLIADGLRDVFEPGK